MRIFPNYFNIDTIFDPHLNRPIKRLVVMLPGAGCAWAKLKHGGCNMCGFKYETDKYSHGIKLPSIVFLLLFLGALFITRGKKPELISIFNGGSFFNDEEIPFRFQLNIFRYINYFDHIKQVLIESRPEFISDHKMKSINKLTNKEIIVGIGLECFSDHIREKCINKGFTFEDYKIALSVLKDNNVKVLTYLFIKPLFLTEKQAIIESILSAEKVFYAGSDYVVFNAGTVHCNTLMDKYHKRNEYSPPKLWTIMEILRATYNLGAIRIGDFNDAPMPISSPSNCSKCNSEFTKMFMHFKENHNINIFNSAECECRKSWLEMVR
ncbi:MAG: archaeosine biosynthesis radical SAM protein RaSEA [Candidatus Margulisiibacteriota bacterium]